MALSNKLNSLCLCRAFCIPGSFHSNCIKWVVSGDGNISSIFNTLFSIDPKCAVDGMFLAHCYAELPAGYNPLVFAEQTKLAASRLSLTDFLKLAKETQATADKIAAKSSSSVC